jgi:hypothetical protein
MDFGGLITPKRILEGLLMFLSLIVPIYLYISRKISDSRTVSSLLMDLSDGNCDTIDFMLAKSNLPGLNISDIVHNLASQKATVTAIIPVLKPHLLEAFLKQVLKIEPRSPEDRWDSIPRNSAEKCNLDYVRWVQIAQRSRALLTFQLFKVGPRIILFPIRNLQLLVWLRLRDCIRILGVETDGCQQRCTGFRVLCGPRETVSLRGSETVDL